MPGQAILAKLAVDGVSEAIALGGIAAGTATFIGTLPDNFVSIGTISVSLSTAGHLYVGDRFVITGQIDVSYGEVSGREGKLLIEVIEQGTGVLRKLEWNARAPKERVSIRLEGRAINDGKKFYYIKVTAAGEEDLSYWPTGDTPVTKVAESDTVAIDVKKPLSFTTELLSPAINHGEFARVIMKVTNHSESDARFQARIMQTYSYFPRLLRPRETDVRIIDHLGAHPEDNHQNEQIFYIEPVLHLYHMHFMLTPDNDVVFYDQLEPDDEKIFDPIPVSCKGNIDRRFGYIPDPWSESETEGEYAYACVAIDENDNGLRCRALLRDDFGNSLSSDSDATGKIELEGKLLGQVATLKITPNSVDYSAYKVRIPLNQKVLNERDDKYKFYPPRLPLIRGVVMLPEENRPVGKAKVQLIDKNREIVSETITKRNGKFYLNATTKSFVDGKAMLKAILPWNITYDWNEQEILQEISQSEVETPDYVFSMKSSVKPQENWVTIEGGTFFKDFNSGEFQPAAKIEIVIQDEMREIVDKTISDDNGNYSFGVKPGRYFFEVTNAQQLGYRPVPRFLFKARSSRQGANIRLGLPIPNFHRQSVDVLKWTEKLLEGDRLAIIKDGEIVSNIEPLNESLYIDLRHVDLEQELEVAVRRGEVLGPTTRLLSKG